MNCSPPGFSVHGILQARILEWVAMPFSRGSSPPKNGTQVSSVTGRFSLSFFLVLPLYCYQPISLHPRAHMLSHVIPWTAARQAPLSMDSSRQEYWSGLPSPPTGRFFTTEPSGKPPVYFTLTFYSPLLSCHFHEIKVHLLQEVKATMQKLNKLQGYIVHHREYSQHFTIINGI